MENINFMILNNGIIYKFIKFIFFMLLHLHNPLKKKKKNLMMRNNTIDFLTILSPLNALVSFFLHLKLRFLQKKKRKNI